MIYYIAKMLTQWKDLDVEATNISGLKGSLSKGVSTGNVGVLLVFDSPEALHSVHPNAEYFIMTDVPQKEDTDEQMAQADGDL